MKEVGRSRFERPGVLIYRLEESLDPRFHLKKQLAWQLERRHPQHFVPRYSMVMFHHLPYAEAQRRGAIQQTMLDELLGEHDSIDAVDMREADRLIGERLPGAVLD